MTAFLAAPSWQLIDDGFEYSGTHFSNFENNYIHNFGASDIIAGDVLFLVLTARKDAGATRTFAIIDSHVGLGVVQNSWYSAGEVVEQQIWTFVATGTIPNSGNVSAARILKAVSTITEDDLTYQVFRLRDSGDIEGFIGSALELSTNMTYLEQVSVGVISLAPDNTVYIAAIQNSAGNTDFIDEVGFSSIDEWVTNSGTGGCGNTTIIFPNTDGTELVERLGNNANDDQVHIWALGAQPPAAAPATPGQYLDDDYYDQLGKIP